MSQPHNLQSNVKQPTILPQDVWLLDLKLNDRRKAIAMGCRSIEEWRTKNPSKKD